MQKIKVQYKNSEEILKNYSFTGEWIVKDIPDDYGYFSAAKTSGGRIFILWKGKDDDCGRHEIIESFDDIIDDVCYPEDFLSAVAESLPPVNL